MIRYKHLRLSSFFLRTNICKKTLAILILVLFLLLGTFLSYIEYYYGYFTDRDVASDMENFIISSTKNSSLNIDSQFNEETFANSTLGFERIYYVTTPNKDIHKDAIVLQSALSGLRVQYFPGVFSDKIDLKNIPPMSKESLKPGAIACYRAHANIWRHMLESELKTILILEGDAAWDMNFRAMMPKFKYGLESLMRHMNFLAPNEIANPLDPYFSSHWDILQFGSCYFSKDGIANSIKYYDPYVLSGQKIHDVVMKENERMIRYRAKDVCTTAYAVSRRGAMKLLARHNIDINEPIDVVISDMIDSKILDSYSVFPAMVFQWKYNSKIGVNDRTSDIDSVRDSFVFNIQRKKEWKKIHKTFNIWDYSKLYSNSRQKNPVLFHLKDTLMSKVESLDKNE